ncbi:MAG: 3-dehydroquinate synthase [Clostridiales bacterium]|nr:3-dehydroquinate synthase [Clostridiales bacterium]
MPYDYKSIFKVVSDIKTIPVQLEKRSYSIYLDDNWESLFQEGLSSIYTKDASDRKLLLITDENVANWYQQAVEEQFRNLGFTVTTAVIKPGESAKTLGEAEKLYDIALEANLDRQSLVVALGGGVIGDLAGFVAATYMRGVPFVQIPTSLLAQVDSSVGGKVAVNHPKAKNVIGAFYQPQSVLMNVSSLKTLPKRELSTGLAEVIKYGVIYDESFLSWLETHMTDLMSLDLSLLSKAIQRSCEIKADVVSQDETEQGLRAILNFGHTVGHAIESSAGYGSYTHGEAVSIGMIVETRITHLMGMVPAEYVNRLEAVLIGAGLPVTLPDVDPNVLIGWMRHDKKNIGDKIGFVLPVGPGRVEVFHNVETDIVLEALA